MADGRMVSEAELEALVEKRLKERHGIINEALGALKPDLDRMVREIASANHIKRTLGRQIASLDRSIKKTALALDVHTQLAWHVGTTGILDRLSKNAEVIGELGVNTLSQEQRKALPAVLEEHVHRREERREDDRKAQRRQVFIHLASSFLSALVTAIVVVTGFVAWLSARGVHP